MSKREDREEIIRILREFADQLLENGLRINSLVLTGSYARGDWLLDSDLDIIIVFDDFKGLKFYEREELILRKWKYPLPLEPWCYTRDEIMRFFKEKPRIDVIDALEQGIVIYDDGFWRKIKTEYRNHPYKKSKHGFIILPYNR